MEKVSNGQSGSPTRIKTAKENRFGINKAFARGVPEAWRLMEGCTAFG